MKQVMAVFALVGMTSGVVCADDPAMSVTLNPEQAQARQFGIYFGGTATAYDLCVRKGFLAKGDQDAEQTATSILDRIRATNKGPDESAYVQDGWDMMKKEISQNESFYTKEKCAFVGKEWAKIIASIKKK